MPTAEHPLLLEELIDLVPEAVDFQLEVKAHADPALARRTAEVLCERLRGEPIRDRVEVISFIARRALSPPQTGSRPAS